jgi:uncharacterized membrane protein
MNNGTSYRDAPSFREKWLHRIFVIGIALKGIDGVLETVGGALFLLINRPTLNRIVVLLTQHELLEDPDDLIANALRHVFSHLSAGGKLFGGVYLLVHGTLKIFLVLCLLRNKLWSYPVAIAFLAAFICYQVYRVSVHFSWGLTALTGLDLVVALLIWHEYRYLKRCGGVPVMKF